MVPQPSGVEPHWTFCSLQLLGVQGPELELDAAVVPVLDVALELLVLALVLLALDDGVEPPEPVVPPPTPPDVLVPPVPCTKVGMVEQAPSPIAKEATAAASIPAACMDVSERSTRRSRPGSDPAGQRLDQGRTARTN